MQFFRSRLRLCFIAEFNLLENGSLYDKCEELTASGVTSIFFRVNDGKKTSDSYAKELRKAIDLCRERNVYSFIFDDPLLSLRLNTSGVYFSYLPKNINRLREVMGENKFVGIMLSDLERGQEFINSNDYELIDFVGVGPVLQFGDKKTLPMGIDHAKQLTQKLEGKPAFWAGGIRPDDIPNFGHCFADGIGAVRCFDNKNICGMHDLLCGSLGPLRKVTGSHIISQQNSHH